MNGWGPVWRKLPPLTSLAAPGSQAGGAGLASGEKEQKTQRLQAEGRNLARSSGLQPHDPASRWAALVPDTCVDPGPRHPRSADQAAKHFLGRWGLLTSFGSPSVLWRGGVKREGTGAQMRKGHSGSFSPQVCLHTTGGAYFSPRDLVGIFMLSVHSLEASDSHGPPLSPRLLSYPFSPSCLLKRNLQSPEFTNTLLRPTETYRQLQAPRSGTAGKDSSQLPPCRGL